MRTNPPFASATNACAKNARTCSCEISATQRISRLRSFELEETGKIHTALSLQAGATIETRNTAGRLPQINAGTVITVGVLLSLRCFHENSRVLGGKAAYPIILLCPVL